MDSPNVIKVAVLGGGLGALSAAFELTRAELRGRYEVTLYQQGWRLGGKCATGRGQCDRIEEHGLHMLMGFYERAFALFRAAHAEWSQMEEFCAPEHPLRDFAKCLEPMYDLRVMEFFDGRWIGWDHLFPERAGVPGSEGPSVPRAARDFVEPLMSRALVQESALGEVQGAAALFAPLKRAMSHWTELNSAVAAAASEEASAARAIKDLEEQIASFNALEATPNWSDTTRRALWIAIYATVIAVGIVKEALKGGFETLDSYEIRDWLRRHGMSERLSRWIPVQLMYDLGFAYRNGDNSAVHHGSAAAGVTLRIMLRCALGYKQAPLFRMKAGMADTLLTPLYRALQRRGVKFKFFHRVTAIRLARDGSTVDAIELEQQAELAGAAAEYEPLERGADLVERWPNAPRWSQLKETSNNGHNFELPTASPSGKSVALARRERNREGDFDSVVLGISVGGLRKLSGDLHRIEGWQRMLDGVPTVKTQAVQLWFERSPLASNSDGRLFCTYAPPFSTISDMSDVLAREHGCRGRPPARSLQYLVSCLPDSDPKAPASDEERVRAALVRWLADHASTIWPAVSSAPLYHPRPDASYDERLQYAHVVTYHNPSDRYVQSFPESIPLRLPSKLERVTNLGLAGDWVRTGLNAGCVESAVQGGIQAANAIRGLAEILID